MIFRVNGLTTSETSELQGPTLENVEKKEIRIPKGFDYGEFSKSIKTEISHVLAKY